MEKNDFLLINNTIYQIYTAPTIEKMKSIFLNHLKLIIPYSYASIMMAETKDNDIHLVNPFCYPPDFLKAELEYLKNEEIDHTNWLNYCTESEIIRESDILLERKRLSSPIYQKCYQHYNIYDTMQMSIVYEKQFLGILTLYRTREDGAFSEEEVFYLHELGKHLNYIFYDKLIKKSTQNTKATLTEVSAAHHLTKRESEILGLIFDEFHNQEIVEKLMISEHTLQKHLQNIYRKLGVSTKWDLLKFR